MPPTLDLGRTRHKTIVSPRINLRRAASYNHDRGPLSSTSSRFNFDHLFFSPPPSPGLPALAPPRRRSQTGRAAWARPSRAVRRLAAVLGVVCVVYLGLLAVRHTPALPLLHRLPLPPSSHGSQGPAAQVDVPDRPAAVVVPDKQGRTKWTVSIPASSGFPLTEEQYAEIRTECREVSGMVQALHQHSHGLTHSILSLGPSSWQAGDPNFLDVREAEQSGRLAKKQGDRPSNQGHDGRPVGSGLPVCETSMTFVLGSSEAGLGKTLMKMWAAYGLAQKEGRAFFLDDNKWAYGRYSDIFEEPPQPDCRPPPSNEILPCPRQARHLVASATTPLEALGVPGSGTTTSETPDLATQHEMFELVRGGYEALFKLNVEDKRYVDEKVQALAAKRFVPSSKGHRSGMAIGVHVRRGDLHPLEYQYRYSYIPLNLYAEAARRLQDEIYDGHGQDGITAKKHSFMVLASDDPTVYESDEFASSHRAQDRIQLASKSAIQDAAPNRHVMRKFVDDTFGWEGGFFAPMFWNLGQPGGSSSTAPGSAAAEPSASAETIRLRSLMGRAYMMDLAVLADVSDAIICTVSASGCRLLAVMMGWESAMEEGNWVNVDGRYGWTIVPEI